jgi:hypothetical protein
MNNLLEFLNKHILIIDGSQVQYIDNFHDYGYYQFVTTQNEVYATEEHIMYMFETSDRDDPTSSLVLIDLNGTHHLVEIWSKMNHESIIKEFKELMNNSK